MTDETRYLLDGILADWYSWSRNYLPVASHGRCAMFAAAKSSGRQWDSEGDVLDASLHSATMATVDFQIAELPPLQRTSIGLQARNLATGRAVWSSARLPADAQERAVILGEARAALTVRLVGAGVL